MSKIYCFNWPSPVGGADTKFVHLLRLLAERFDLTVVPNRMEQFRQDEWRDFLAALGVAAVPWNELPGKLEGWALSLCNGPFFTEGIIGEVRRRGLKVVWSSEMMWHFDAELGAVAAGWIDRILYVSPIQRAMLEPGYRQALSGAFVTREAVLPDPREQWGKIHAQEGNRTLSWVMTGNFVDPEAFPFQQRGGWREKGSPFTIGRLSRPDPDKFPEAFPDTYENLGLGDFVKFRVMGWSRQLAERWASHSFDSRWDLVETAGENTVAFLASLDLFVYDLGPRFRESWGRAVVEAMLTGAVPLVPRGCGHHLENLVSHGIAGFLCDGTEDYGRYARMLQADSNLLRQMSAAARTHAVANLCNREQHLALWRRVFEDWP